MSHATKIILTFGALVNLAIWAWVYHPHGAPDWNNGSVAGVSFSPYERGQDPENGDAVHEETIRRDLELLSNLTRRVRTYSVLGGLHHIPADAMARGLSVTAGAWISTDFNRNGNEISSLINLANKHLNIDRLLVGNEALLREDVSTDTLISAIATVRKKTRKPVSTAEPWHVWLANPALADSVDFIGVQLLPYWEGVPVKEAVPYLMARLAQVQAAYPDKPIVLTEIGWPSAGRAIGGARANRTNQALFLREFLTVAAAKNLDYFLIEAFDQPWKISFEGMAGGYWGLFDVDRQEKFPWTGPIRERDDWWMWALFAIGFSAILGLLYAQMRPTLRLPGALLLVGITQTIGSALIWALIPMGSLYLSSLELAVWGLLFVAAVFLVAGVLVDLFEATDLMWTGPLRRKFAAPILSNGVRDAPKVSIHVPICNEPPALVRRTLAALANLDYPNYEVIVLDNNTYDDALWAPVEIQCQTLGRRFRFFRYPKLSGYKGGALNRALEHSATDTEIIGVIDSDYVVKRDWLKSLVPFFTEAEIGFVQAPQDYRDSRENPFKRFCFWEYAGFFRIGMVRRNEKNAIIQHGTMTLIRRHALDMVGGWSDWCITEDAELGLRLAHDGWKSAYVAESYGQGVTPDCLGAYKGQRFRWAYGAMQILKRRWRWLFAGRNTKLTRSQRFQYLAGWFPWISDAAGLFFTTAAIAWTVALIAFPKTTELPPAAFLAPSLAAFLFRQWRLFKLYGHADACPARDRAKAALAGLALSHTVAKAVIAGLVTSSRPFKRTPKYQKAPRLLRGLMMAAEEAAILLCLTGAAAGFVVTNGLWHVDAMLWLAILTVLALPYAATIILGAINGLPLRAKRTAQLRGGTPAIPAYPPGERRRKRRP